MPYLVRTLRNVPFLDTIVVFRHIERERHRHSVLLHRLFIAVYFVCVGIDQSLHHSICVWNSMLEGGISHVNTCILVTLTIELYNYLI